MKKSLRITVDERRRIMASVEDAIYSHMEGMISEIRKSEEEAKEQRLAMFDETAIYCKSMTIDVAKDILFNEYTMDQILSEYQDYEKIQVASASGKKYKKYICNHCNSTFLSTKKIKNLICATCNTLIE